MSWLDNAAKKITKDFFPHLNENTIEIFFIRALSQLDTCIYQVKKKSAIQKLASFDFKLQLLWEFGKLCHHQIHASNRNQYVTYKELFLAAIVRVFSNAEADKEILKLSLAQWAEVFNKFNDASLRIALIFPLATTISPSACDIHSTSEIQLFFANTDTFLKNEQIVPLLNLFPEARKEIIIDAANFCRQVLYAGDFSLINIFGPYDVDIDKCFLTVLGKYSTAAIKNNYYREFVAWLSTLPIDYWQKYGIEIEKTIGTFFSNAVGSLNAFSNPKNQAEIDSSMRNLQKNIVFSMIVPLQRLLQSYPQILPTIELSLTEFRLFLETFDNILKSHCIKMNNGWNKVILSDLAYYSELFFQYYQYLTSSKTINSKELDVIRQNFLRVIVAYLLALETAPDLVSRLEFSLTLEKLAPLVQQLNQLRRDSDFINFSDCFAVSLLESLSKTNLFTRKTYKLRFFQKKLTPYHLTEIYSILLLNNYLHIFDELIFKNSSLDFREYQNFVPKTYNIILPILLAVNCDYFVLSDLSTIILLLFEAILDKLINLIEGELSNNNRLIIICELGLTLSLINNSLLIILSQLTRIEWDEDLKLFSNALFKALEKSTRLYWQKAWLCCQESLATFEQNQTIETLHKIIIICQSLLNDSNKIPTEWDGNIFSKKRLSFAFPISRSELDTFIAKIYSKILSLLNIKNPFALKDNYFHVDKFEDQPDDLLIASSYRLIEIYEKFYPEQKEIELISMASDSYVLNKLNHQEFISPAETVKSVAAAMEIAKRLLTQLAAKEQSEAETKVTELIRNIVSKFIHEIKMSSLPNKLNIIEQLQHKAKIDFNMAFDTHPAYETDASEFSYQNSASLLLFSSRLNIVQRSDETYRTNNSHNP